MESNRVSFAAVVVAVVASDFITKRIAEANLTRFPRPVLGDWFTFQLVYNPGAAFGLNVGEHSRWVFMILALIALVILGVMVKNTLPTDRFRMASLGLICGGAVGNLIDRITSSRGVVDFIDVGIGNARWPTFNVADMAVTCGAVALAIVLWQEGKQASPQTS